MAWEGVRCQCRDDSVCQNKNYICTINAMNVAIKLSCNTFIGIGSQAEYGKCIGKIDEDYQTNAITEYGRSKLKTYKSLDIIAKENNIKFIWARIFSVYGIYDSDETLVISALNKMVSNEKIQLTQCIQNWDFLYVEDAAKVLYLLGNKPSENGVYNIASGESRKLKDFVLAMKKVLKSTSILQFGAVPYSKEGIVSFEPCVDKLKRNLVWSYQIRFEDGINRILKYICRER